MDVDNAARLDVAKLEKLLRDRLRDQRPVYSVVAVMGSTEEGAVDPLHKILALRQKFQAKGLSFTVHADAAWGGYFATMLPRGSNIIASSMHPTSLPGRDGGTEGIVPDLPLRTETQEDLFAMRFCDSITVDPHKAGYVPYPAGALTYRDGRIRNLVTWTSPYLSRGSVTSIGIFGVEGRYVVKATKQEPPAAGYRFDLDLTASLERPLWPPGFRTSASGWTRKDTAPSSARHALPQLA